MDRHHHDRLFKRPCPKDGGSAVSGPSDFRWHDRALRHLRAGCQQVAVIVPDVRLLVGPPSCTSPFISRQSHHVSSPYFKQLILGLWFGFCFTFHELLGLGLQLQLRRLLRWSSIGAREGFYLLCSLLLEPYGSTWFGSVWGGFLGGILGGIARAGFSHRESALPDPLNY